MLSLLWALAQPLRAQEIPSANEAAAEPAPLLAEPRLIHFQEAAYPPEAEAAKAEGVVQLELDVEADGTVSAARPLISPREDLAAAAVAAARLFRFDPARDANGPVPVTLVFDYKFVLTAAPPPAAEAPPPPPPINLEGELIEMGTRRPLAQASILVQAAGQELQTSTDAQGRWSLRGVPLGPVTVTAALPGYARERREVELKEGEVTSLRLWIKDLSYGDNEIVGTYTREEEHVEVSRRSITVEEMKQVPGTLGDPVRVIQNLPGAARAPFGSGQLIIRGANPEDAAVRVDGTRVPLIYHLGGYVSVLNADLIDAVDYMPGVYGVRYGRAIGGAIDVRTRRDFPEGQATWSTDLLDSGGLVATRVGPDDRIGVAVAARRSYIDAILPVVTRDSGFRVLPRWYDYQAKVVDLGRDDQHLSALVFGSGDQLLFSAPDDVALSTERTVDGGVEASYGFHRFNFEWERDLADGLRLSLRPSIGIEKTLFTLGNAWRFNSTQTTAVIKSELVWEASEHLRLIPGLDVGGATYDVRFELPYSPEDLFNEDPFAETDPYTIRFDGVGWSPDAYVDAQWRPLADPEALVINPGLRLATFTMDGSDFLVALDPRLQARWQLVPGGALKGGVGVYHQSPQGQDFGTSEDNVQVGMERALSSELGWLQDFGDGRTADLTLFHRGMDQLIVSNPDYGVDPEAAAFHNAGFGRAMGVELMLRQALVDRTFGWLSYTLSKSERRDSAEEEWVPFDYDQTHILVAVAGHRLPRDWSVSGRFQYVTGNPYTPYAGGVYDIDQDSYIAYASAETNSERLAPYIALDLRTDKLWSFKRWQLNAYLDLLNVLHGENPEDLQYNYDYTESTPISGLPFVPSPGFEARFYF